MGRTPNIFFLLLMEHVAGQWSLDKNGRSGSEILETKIPLGIPQIR
jgi:hypothetical protein